MSLSLAFKPSSYTIAMPNSRGGRSEAQHNINKYRLQLKRGLFWTDMIQNCTKWSNMGVHGLSYGPFVAKLRCASFLLRKNQEKSQYGPKNDKNVDVREKKSLRSYMPNT